MSIAGIPLAYGPDYEMAGWHPLPIEGKGLNIKRLIGRFPVRTWQTIKRENLQYLIQANSGQTLNLGIRLPDGIIALDIDAYKDDLEKLAELEKVLGPLPPTWNSDSRGGHGGKWLFRVPNGFYARGSINGIVVRHHHLSYIMVFPSWNPESASMYLWYDPSGQVVTDVIPTPEDIPWLPRLWLDAIRSEPPKNVEYDGRPLDISDIRQEWTGPICPRMEAMANLLDAELQEADNKHPTCLDALRVLVRLAADGHGGLDVAVHQLFVTYVSFSRTRDMASDFHRMLGTVVAQQEYFPSFDLCGMTITLVRQQVSVTIKARHEVHTDPRLATFCPNPVIPLYFYPSGYTFHRPVDCRKMGCELCAFKHHIYHVIAFLLDKFTPETSIGIGAAVKRQKKTLQNKLVGSARFTLSRNDGGIYTVSEKVVGGLRTATVDEACIELASLEANTYGKIYPTIWPHPVPVKPKREKPLFARGNAGDKYDDALKALGLEHDKYYEGSEEECKLIAKRLAAEAGFEVILTNVKSPAQPLNREDHQIYNLRQDHFEQLSTIR